MLIEKSMQESVLAEGNIEIRLPQCECTGCSSEAHRAGDDGRCTASAGASGTKFCTACAAFSGEL